MKITQSSDELADTPYERRTRTFDVELVDTAEGHIITKAHITYIKYIEDNECMFNKRDISMEDGDEDQYDKVVDAIKKILKNEGFGETEQRFT